MDLEGQLKTKLRAEMVTLAGLQMSGTYLQTTLGITIIHHNILSMCSTAFGILDIHLRPPIHLAYNSI